MILFCEKKLSQNIIWDSNDTGWVFFNGTYKPYLQSTGVDAGWWFYSSQAATTSYTFCNMVSALKWPLSLSATTPTCTE